MSEFSRMVDVRFIDAQPLRLEASEAERAALAERFALERIDRLVAKVELVPDKRGVSVKGTLDAAIVQSCAISAEDVPVKIHEPLSLRFVTHRGPARADEEIELAAEDLDQIEYEGTQFDLGEAVAQSLALAIDPFLEGPGAEEFRKTSGLFGEPAASPFAALAKLRKK